MNDKQPIISENESINNIDTSTSINEISNGTFDEIVDSFQSVDKVQEIKKDITAEELKEQNPILEAPLNPTDPYAFHDPTMFFGMIIKSLNTDRGEYEASDAPVTSHKIDAIYFPLIRINQRVINNNDIIYMKLSSEGVLPTLTLTIFDSKNAITNLNSCGVDSEVVVVITSPVEGVYKTIKLCFYINEVSNELYGENRYLYYNCTLKIPMLMQKYSTSMNYPNSNQWPGCTKCKSSEQKIPNSWEMLHYIANECKLGFASTDNCKNISDRNWRLFNSYNTLGQALISEKEFAGTDEEEAIFDWWVDFYGYLVMVNVPWILNYKLTEKNLGINAIVGIKQTSDNNAGPEPQIIMVNRTITNSKNQSTFAANHNLLIKSYEIVTDNILYSVGTCSTFNIFQPKGAGGSNGCQRFDVQVEEQSVSGAFTENYSTNKVFMKSVDMSGTNRQQKKNIFKRYFQNKRAKMLVVELEQYNLGLQRGTLVNVVITESDPTNKSSMVANAKNLMSVNTPEEEDQLQSMNSGDLNGPVDDDQALSKSRAITELNVELPNQGISGLYYIDSISFEYDINKGQQIYQKLKLIKKGFWGNYVTKYGYSQINRAELEK